METKVNIPIL